MDVGLDFWGGWGVTRRLIGFLNASFGERKYPCARMGRAVSGIGAEPVSGIGAPEWMDESLAPGITTHLLVAGTQAAAVETQAAAVETQAVAVETQAVGIGTSVPRRRTSPFYHIPTTRNLNKNTRNHAQN
ncbi:MAG TPA: hypothetical protein VIT91_14075 [Chthoniobacterales bacterium]